MRRNVIITWELSSFFGWGVYGLNLALHWARDPDLKLLTAQRIFPERLALDPLNELLLQTTVDESAKLVASLEPHAGRKLQGSAPVLHPLNHRFRPEKAAHGVMLMGPANIAVVFLESARFAPEALERARHFDLIVAGSSWNAEVLRAHGFDKVTTVLQGIDPGQFHPAPRRGLLKDRFLVFSGGKLERRKGQDLVVAAFRIFAERHPEALLVTAWHSPWPQAAKTLDVSGLAAPMVFRPDGRVDVLGWTAASGLAATQVLDFGLTPNAAMPAVLRECDVALFPNRCEGGTNLVAMEAMACGVPAILAANTGQLDLIDGDNCYPLTRQRELPDGEAGALGVRAHGESDVEEILAALEAAYADRDAARRRGLAGAETLSRLTWGRTAAELKGAVLPFC